MTNYTIISNETITSYLSDKAFRLYSLLQSMAYGDKIQVYPSQKYLAVALRCSIRTIQRALKELVKAGLISIRRRGSISNIYTLLQKKVQQVVDRTRKAVENFKEGTKENINKNKNCNKKYNNYGQNRLDFNDYPQRSYNFTNLESMLLGETEYNPDLLYK